MGATQQTQAQAYKTSIGGRLGPSYGATIKHFFAPKVAIEGLITGRYTGGWYGNIYGRNGFTPGVSGTLLFEWHFPIGRVEGFYWFIGGGFHAGVWDNPAYPLIGLDAIGGIEYTFRNIPLTLQADLKPAFHIFDRQWVWYDEFAISARYTF